MRSSLLPQGGAFQQLLLTELGKRSLERHQKTVWKNTSSQETLCSPLFITGQTGISRAGGTGKGGVCSHQNPPYCLEYA